MKMSEAYDRVKAIDWEPSYISPEEKTVETTKFHIHETKPNDPFKTFVREYCEQEQEKDDRHYALLEASARLNTGEPDGRCPGKAVRLQQRLYRFASPAAGRPRR